MATEQPRRPQVRDMFGSRRAQLVFAVMMIILCTIIGFALNGMRRGGANSATAPVTTTATTIMPVVPRAEAVSVPDPQVPVATPMIVESNVSVAGVTKDIATMLPDWFYDDGTTLGALVYSSSAMNDSDVVKLNTNSWLLLAHGDKVTILENLEDQTVRIRIVTNQFDGKLPDGTDNPEVIGHEVYVKGWVITGEVFAK